ncbi:MAG: FISUMP domain-containing protein [Blastocatellia bacterium]
MSVRTSVYRPVFITLFLLWLLVLTGGHRQSVPAVATGNGTPLSREQWQGIREAHEAWRHKLRADGDGWLAVNRREQLRLRFDRHGFEVEPESGEWRWGLELEGYGVGIVRSFAVPARVSGREGRISYDRDGNIEEWVVNDRSRIEHGFTIQARPAGLADNHKARLTLRFRHRGGLRPVESASGRSLKLGTGNGKSSGSACLEYRDLRAWDATGREVDAWFEAEGTDHLRLVLDETEASYPLTIDPTITQQAYLKASTNSSDGYGDDLFGSAVAINGNTVVIGAPGERSSATGVNGNQLDNSADDSGAAYVFVRNGTTWSQQAYLKASNSEKFDRFGGSVSIFGETIVVGATQEDSAATGINGDQTSNIALESGAAYVFVRSGTAWSQQAYLKASNSETGDFFGSSVSIHGETIIVGAELESSAATGVNGTQSSNGSYSSGAAYVFVRNGTTWSQQAYLKASNTDEGDQFGCAVSINGETAVIGAVLEASAATGVNGNQSDNSAALSGAAYVFVRNGATWSQQGYLKASNAQSGDFFGRSVAIAGDTVLVGAPNEYSAATGVNGDGSDNSTPEAGAAYVFVRTGLNWSQQAYLKASQSERGNKFGVAVAVAADTIVVGAGQESGRARGVNGDQSDIGEISSGAAYVFVRATGGAWSQQAYLKASNTREYSYFGRAVGISGETIIVGAEGEPSATRGINNDTGDHSAENAGAGYSFVRIGSTWSQQAYLKASNTEEFYGPDYFGHAVAIAGDTVVVGAWGEDSTAIGINGDETATRAPNSGAAYVFVRSGANWTQQAYLKASNTGADDNFGRAVAISGDTIVVGAPDEDSAATGVNGDQSSNRLARSGAAYVFVRSGTAWSQQAYLKASNTGTFDRFGWAVGIAGETVVVGAPNEDSAATGPNGNQADNSQLDSGAVYAFTRSGTTWSQQSYLKASNTGSSDNFGVAVAISGDTVVIGSFGESSNATGVNGNQADDSAPDSGAAYVFVRSGVSWNQQAYLKASNSRDDSIFGFTVAISGSTIVVGSPLEDNNATGVNGNQAGGPLYDSGAAYVFVRNGTVWSQQAYLKASNSGGDDKFGRSVAISGETIVIGADDEDSLATGVNGDQSSNLGPDSGAAYLFTRSGTSWSQGGYLKSGNSGGFDNFGFAVGVSINTVVVGASEEDSAVAGINASGADNLAENSGAAYIFLTDSSRPEILSLSPASAPQNSAAFTLTVNGANFVAGSQIRWNGIVRATTFVSANRLTASIGAADLATAGTFSVTVANPAPGGEISNGATFTVTAPNPLPALSSLVPTTVAAGGTSFTLTVSGSGFISDSIVRWNGGSRTTTLISPTQVTASISAGDIATAGTAAITVINPSPGGGVSNSLLFTISGTDSPVPTIGSISPDSAFAGDVGFTITVTGTNFVTGSIVEVDGMARPTTFINVTTLTAEIPEMDIAAPGTRRVGVRTPPPGGGTSGTLNLSVSSLPPTLDSLVPTRVVAGGTGQTLTIYGKIFFNGATIRVDGVARATVRVNEYQLTTTLPASDIARPALLSITVANPGGAVSSPLILPVVQRVTSVSAASYSSGEQAPDSIIAAFSTGLATGVEINNTSPLPTSLRGTRVVVTDSAGVSREQSLFFVAPQQVNYHLHPATARGAAVVTVYINNDIVALGELTVGTLAPAIFTQNASGDGVPAAYGIRVSGSNVSAVNILTYDSAQSRWIPIPIDPGTASEPVYLALFGTGFRRASGAGGVVARIGSTSIPVQFIGATRDYVGLDQLNIGPLPLTLAGSGIQPLTVSIDGVSANQSRVMQLSFASPSTASCGTVTDIDGNAYPTVIIGAQCWMGENLRVTRYREGTVIPLDESGGVAGNSPGEVWSPRTSGARTIYANTSANLPVYGYIYNWHAAADPRGLCPSGWHLPTDGEWATLLSALGTNPGGKLRSTGTSLWLSPNTGATNESGFAALPGGIRSDRGDFGGIRTIANFWTASRTDGRGAVGRFIVVGVSEVGSDYHGERSGLSVRCVRK